MALKKKGKTLQKWYDFQGKEKNALQDFQMNNWDYILNKINITWMDFEWTIPHLK